MLRSSDFVQGAREESAAQRRKRLLRRKFLLGSMSIMGLSGCDLSPPEGVFQIRLTFHFSHLAEQRSFSGVWEARETRVSAFPNPGGGITETLIGEAIPMVFGGGKNAFALLVDYGGGGVSDGSMGLYTWKAAPTLAHAYGTQADWAQPGGDGVSALSTAAPMAPVALPIDSLPALATFDDLNDPLSGRLIHPDELSAIAGEGWAFDRAEIELVDDPPTRGASELLPWVNAPPANSGTPSWTDFRLHPEFFVRKPPLW